MNNPNELAILGDGAQRKSYMHIEDCVDSIIHLTRKIRRERSRVEIYNVGSEDSITTKEIAGIVAQEMKVPNIAFKFTSGVDDGRGWRGDVKTMQLSIERLLQTGWKPKHSGEQAVRLTARALTGKTRQSMRGSR
jgi:UDP-glucose 4-epimerase